MDAILQHGPTVLLFIIVLALLVLVHELGHFLVARFFGIGVEEFGFGFPPRAFGVRKGDTAYSLNWIPLGGFVRIRGEDDPNQTGPGTFASKRALIRAAVIAAGVFMNLVLASLLFALGFTVGLPQLVEDLPPGARVRDPRIQIIEVLPDSPAEAAGIRMGDIVVSLDGQPRAAVADIQAAVNASSGPVRLEVRRGKEMLVREVEPKLDEKSGKRILGVALAETAIVSFPWHSSLAKGAVATGFYAKEIVLTVVDLIRGALVGEKPGVEFSGPVGIAVLTGRAAKLGFVYLVQFAALLSVNLAVVNILPIPALDGGRLLFILIEKFRGRSVRPIVEAFIHKIAFFALLGLVVIVTIKDIDRYKEQILQALKSLFGVT
jgi:regulator of sigma E protease